MSSVYVYDIIHYTLHSTVKPARQTSQDRKEIYISSCRGFNKMTSILYLSS